MKFIFASALVLAVAVAVSGAPADQKCGPREVFQSCGTACPEHCPVFNTKTGEIDIGSNRPCTLNCVPGCYCAPGLVRDLKRNGECVEKAACPSVDIPLPGASLADVEPQPQQCGPNEVFMTCGSPCPEHCPMRDAKTGEIDDGHTKICLPMCKIGCACAHGYVRDLKRNGACVEKALCSAPQMVDCDTSQYIVLFCNTKKIELN